MRHTVHKCFLAWDYEKEEKWLNEMSAKGLQLVSTSIFKYVFEEGAPNEYQYRLEFLNQYPTHPESLTYIRFLEETGVEHIGSLMRWVYFRKKTADGPFDLYSDLTSKIKHYKLILALLLTLTPINIFGAGSNLHHFLSTRHWPSLFMSTLSLFVLIFLGIGGLSLARKIHRFKKAQLIQE